MNAVEFYTKITDKNKLLIPEDVIQSIKFNKNSSVKVIILQEENEEETNFIASSPELVQSISRIRKSNPKKLLNHKEVFGNEL